MKTDWRINGKQETHVPKCSPENNKLKEASEDSIKGILVHYIYMT